MPNLTPQDVDVRLTETRNEFSEEHTRLWEGLEDEKVSRIAGDEANKQFTEQVQGENAGTESRLSTEVIHRAAGDLNNITSLNALAVALSDYRIKTDLEIANEKIARQQLGVDLNTRVDNFVASWDHDKFLIYTAIQAVQTDVDGKYASMDLRIKKYEDMLQDITMDSIQITMDNGEINMGAWTILSQAREWDLEILSNVKGYQNQTTEDLNQALEDLQNKLPVTQGIINQALEQLGNSPIIKDLEAEIGGLEGTIDGVTQTMMDHRVETQNQLVNMSKELGDQVKAETDARAKAIQEEAAARLEAVQREAAIRQQQLTQESADRTAEIDEKIKDFEGGIATDLTVINKRVDDVEANLDGLSTKLDTDIADVNQKVVDANAKVDRIKTETDAKIVTLTNKSNQLVTDLKAEETARIADVKKLNDGLTAEIKFRKDGDTANLTALNNYKTSNDQALANVREELRVNVTATTANAQKISALDTRLTANESLAASAVSKAETALTETSALATQMDSVNASIDGLETELAKKADATAVNQLIADVKVIDGKVTTNSADITTLKTNVTTLDGKVTGNTTAISELKTTQTQQGDKITQLTADTTLLKNEMTAVKDDLATKVDSTAFNELSTKVTKNDGDITAQGQSITRIDNSLTITNDKLEKKAEASAFTALDSKVTSIDDKVTSNTSAITSLTGRVTTNEQNIAKKLDASVIDKYSTTVDTNKAIADRITSYDASLVIGGTNLLPNADWANKNASGTPLKWTTGIAAGTNGTIKVEGDKATYEYVAATRVSDISLKADIAGDTLLPITTSFELVSVEGNPEIRTTVQVFYTDGTNTSSNMTYRPRPYQAGKRLSVTSTPSITAGKTPSRINVWFSVLPPEAGSSGKVVIRLPQAETGNKATAWGIGLKDLQEASGASAGAIQSIQAQVTDHEGRITSNSSAITSLTGRVTVNEGNIAKKADASAVSSLTTRVETAEGKITSQGTAITKLTNDLAVTDGKVALKADSSVVSALDSKVTQQGKDITSQGSAITKLTNDLSTTNTEVSKKANASALTALDNKVTSIDGKVTSQGTQITELKNSLEAIDLELDGKADSAALQTLDSKVTQQGKDITAQGTAITNLTGRVTTAEGGINKKADTTALNALSTKVETIDGKVVANSNSITSLNSLVTTNTDNIAKKADASALQALDTKVTQQGNNITSQGSAITKLTNDLAVTNTEVSKKATTAALQTLDTKVTQQGKDITSVSTAQTALGNRVTTVEGTLTTKANSSAVQQLDSRVTAAEGKITSQGTSITNLQNSLTTLDGKVNTKVDSTAFNALSTKVNVQGTSIDSHSQQLTTLSNSIAGKADSSVVSTLDSKVNKIDKNVTANTSAITALKSGLDGKADVTALNSLTTEVSLINGVTTTNASNISALNSTVSAMDGRVTSQSAAIDVLTVKQKQFGDTLNQVVQDTTVLTNKVTGLDNEVKANTQAITDTKAEVTKNGTDIKALTEKTTTVEAKVDNIKSGGDNLLKKSNVPAVWNPADPKYPHGKWDMSEPWEVGATYTLTVCVTHKSTVGETHVAFYAGGGRQYVAGITNAGDRFIRTIQFVKTAVDANNPTIQAYLAGWETNINAIGTIHWVVMTKGASVGVTNWKPSNQDTVDALANTASAEALQNLRAEVNVIDGKVIAATNDLTILKSAVDTNQANLVNNYYTKTQANEATAGQITSFSAGLNIGGENLIYGTKKFDTTGNLKPNTHGFGTYWPHDLLFGTHTMYTATTAWTGFCFTGFKDNVADVDMVLSFWASSVGGQDIPVYNIASGSDTLLFTVKGFEWKQYSAKIPKGTRITNGSRGIAEFSIPAGGTLAYGAIQLQKGTKATAWTPAYNDFDNPIKANASAVQSVSAQVTEIDGKVSASASQILTLESFKNNINNGRIPGHKELVIDLRTGYNQDTYFPVAVSPISVTNRTRLRVYSTLDGKAKPAWSTHGSGFSLTLDWETTGNGWGIINAEQVINNSEWLYTLNGICPALGPTQMGNSSEPVVYLRGGGYYVISLPEPNTIRICPPSGSIAGINGQTVSPIAYNGGMVPMSVSKDATTTKVRLQQTNEVIDGVKAVSTVSVDNNGFLSGYGLISQLVNGVVQSAFGVNADYFYVGTSNNNKKKPFMVLTSPQNIGGVTYPAGTWMDVALIANATIGTAHIQDASITNAKIKDLNANKITAGIINADRIGANTITAEKLVIGDTTNLWGNQYFESNVRPMNARSAWFGYTPQLKGRGVQMWGRDHMAPYSTRIPIKAGDEFVIEFTAGLNTGAFKALGVGLWVYDATGSQGTYAFQFGVPEQIATLGNGWYRYRRVFTVADNGSGLPAAYGTLYFQIPQSDTEANPTYWTAGDVVVRKRVGGELIVNGAITADKLSVNDLSAVSATIGLLRTSSSGARTEIRDNLIQIYDSSNKVRVKIGVF